MVLGENEADVASSSTSSSSACARPRQSPGPAPAVNGDDAGREREEGSGVDDTSTRLKLLEERFKNVEDRKTTTIYLLIPQKGRQRLRLGNQTSISEIKEAFKPKTATIIYKGRRLRSNDPISKVKDGDVLHCWISSSVLSSSSRDDQDPITSHASDSDDADSCCGLWMCENLAPRHVFWALVLAILGYFWGLLLTNGMRYFNTFSVVMLAGLSVVAMQHMNLGSSNSNSQDDS
mmetsp:Transcript_38572/g.61853  ORF Transcript_38572/g.61853 Transcript_38572/m.61853 type:complete len:234 (-) Transcript_38572:60-761(-)